MIGKIVLSISIAFLVAFSGLVYAIYEIEPDGICRLQNDFYSQKFSDNKKKIFLLGGSQEDRLNSTHITEILINNNSTYDVYNLSVPSDRPLERLWSIEKIISLKPELIVYGLSIRDFSPERGLNIYYEKPSGFLPDPHDTFDNILFFEKNLPFCTTSLKDPKLASLKIIRELMGQTEKIQAIYSEEKMPFSKYYTDEHLITNSYEKIQNHPDLRKEYSGIDYEGKNIKSLYEIIKKFHENKIRVILFSAPLHELYLNKIPEYDKQGFISILKNMEEEFDVSVYYLHDKYSKQNIWNDPFHVAKNSDGLIYSEDIAGIILNELLEE